MIALGAREVRLTDEEFALLGRVVRAQTGIALGPGKRALVEARLGRRVAALGLPSYLAYHRRLAGPEGPDEVQHLVDAITTQTTALFREAAHFEFLARELAPQWAARAGRAGARVRLWSAACSTGQEAYTLAAVARAHLPPPEQLDTRVLATDISRRALALAQAASYPLAEAEAVPPAYRASFPLQPRRGRLGVAEPVRQLVTLRPLNLLAGRYPFRHGFDAIFCRNVFIYFDEALRRALVERLAGCLAPGGHLFLGLSEALVEVPPALQALGRSIYRRREGAPWAG